MRTILTSAFVLYSLGGLNTASANTVQDQQGAGSRTKAMGGAGTALANDATAVYYNPASLSHCKANQASIEFSHWVYGLDVESEVDEFTSDALQDRSALTLSACIHLPYGLSVGFLFDTGLSQVQSLNQTTLNGTPEFAIYGKPLQQISMLGGLSYQINNRLSVGIGGALLVNSGLQISAEIPIVSSDREIAGRVEWTLDPAAAFYAGVRYTVSKPWTIAASIRTALFHKLEAQAQTRVEIAGVLIDVDLLLENVAWYSPLQAALGSTYSVSERATVAADLTWYHWSAYPGPFIQISPLDPDDGVAAGLNYPPLEPTDFRDIVVPRIGVEYFVSDQVALRSGIAYRQTPANIPKARDRANLLDASVTTISLGAGYEWIHPEKGTQKKSTEPSAEKRTEPSAEKRTEPSAEKRTEPSAENGTELKGTLSTITFDLHMRFHRMDGVDVRKVIGANQTTTFHFGGMMYDAGLTMTVAW